MDKAIKAGDLTQIKGILAQRFPALRFEESDLEDAEIAKPEEKEAAPTPMAVDEEKDQSTKELYDSYLATMPMAVRGLVTTDYKGTRGGRLGAGGVYTADMLPGVKAEAPKEEAPKATTPAQSTVTTTYNAPVIGGDWQQYYGDYYAGNVSYGGGGDRGSSSSTPSAPSAPSAPAPSLNQQVAAKAISQAGGGGVSAAAKSTGSSGSLNYAETKALLSSGLSPSQIEQRIENQGLKLTDNARRALQGKGKQ